MEITAQTIIDGQNRIDKMRIEIKQLLNSILGYIKDESFIGDDLFAERNNKKYRSIGHQFEADQNGYCWVMLGDKFILLQQDISGRFDNVELYITGRTIRLYDVVRVYDSLDSLLPQLLKLFPELEKKFNVFITASIR